MSARKIEGLSSAEAERRLVELGPPEPITSRSVGSIVAGNVFTLFNAIILIFFLVVISQGLWQDALFGLIAIVNTAIGIRQELKAKDVLDSLALLVAPKAKAIRDGDVREVGAGAVVPGDVVRIEPGDQLVADGKLISSRGLTMDESVLTGESDGARKGDGDEVLSGSFCISGSGVYEVDAVRGDSYAERIAGEAKAFRHPLSPLQVEVNRVLLATAILIVPLGAALLGVLRLRETPLEEAVQTATAGLITLVPEGLVLLMSVTLAVAAVRLARMNTLVQQMNAPESLASVDTVCIDKTGTLTDGSLELIAVETGDSMGEAQVTDALGRFAASAGERNRTLEAIADRFPAGEQGVEAEVPFSSEWKWSGATLGGSGRGETYVLGAPDVLSSSGAVALDGALGEKLAEHTRAGRRVLVFGRSSGALPDDPTTQAPPSIEPLGLVVLEESLRPEAANTVAYMREQGVDLKLISGDARATVTAVAHAVGIPTDAGVIEGDELPEDEDELARVATKNTIFCRIRPDQKKSLVAALSAAGRYTAMIGDGVNDVPALKQARMAVAMGSGAQITKGIADIVLLKDSFSMLPRAVGEGRRIARNIHRLARLYVTKTVYAAFLIGTAGIAGFPFPFLPRHLTIAAFITIGVPSFVLALAPSDGPLYRGRLLRALAAFAIPAGVAVGAASLLSFFLIDSVFAGSIEDGRTAATSTLIFLGLAFILLLERGPGREHIAISSYMLALVVMLGGLFALSMSAEPLRDFFELTLLGPGQWSLVMLSAAAGLLLAGALWRLPRIQALEENVPPPDERDKPLESPKPLPEAR